MKRMTLIAAALCLIMLTTVGAGVVTAKQTENPRQAGDSSVYFYNVAPTDVHGPGKLKIDVKQHTFVFTGKGFDPAKTYYLQYKLGTTPGTHTFASVAATPSGNVHLKGTWTKDIATLPAVPAFSASITPNPVQAVLTAEWLGTLRGPTGIGTAYWWLDASSSTGNIARYELVVIPSNPPNDPGTVIYDGASPTLGDSSDRGYGFAISPGMVNTAVLIVYDSFRNSDAVALTLNPP